MTINDNTKRIELPERSLRKEEIMEIAPELYPTISQNKQLLERLIHHNDTLYFIKITSKTELLNELIGVYLAKLIGLNTVNYEIATIGNSLYVASPLFYEPNHLYQTCTEHYKTSATKVLVREKEGIVPKLLPISVLKVIDNPELLDDILKLIALDLKMDQYDRHNLNVTLDTYDGTTTLAPTYDYSASYYYHTDRYNNPFVIINRRSINIWFFAQMYPHIKPYLKTLKETPITDILEQIAKDFDINITNKEYDTYNQKDKQISRTLIK